MTLRVAVLAAAAAAGLAAPVVTVDGLGLKSFGAGRSQVRVPKDGEFELLAHTLGAGATHGVITHWWNTGAAIADGSGHSIADFVTWRFYVDGEANASIVLQTAQAHLVGDVSTQATWGNDFVGKNSAWVRA
jgi:hypothetical protein